MSQVKSISAETLRATHIESRSFSADVITPILAFTAIREHHAEAVLLESLEDKQQTGRFSHIGFDLLAEITIDNHEIDCSIPNIIPIDAQPLTALKTFYRSIHTPSDDKRVAIIGGLVGYMHYESVAYFEHIPVQQTPKQNPTIHLKSFNMGITFDHQTNELIISARINNACTSAETNEIINTIFKKINTYPKFNQIDTHKSDELCLPDDTQLDIDDENFKTLVEKAKQHIIDGDIFQVVISRRFTTPFKGDPLVVYRALRHLNPSPYMFYLPLTQGIIIGASPEKLVSLHNGILEVNPLAGTRARNAGSNNELLVENDLRTDEKECAEHMMLVDLARNDLGRIAELGSVRVKNLMQIKKYKHVMHLSSTVSATIKPEYDAFDALAATFPAGTLSGAPKIRAMEIISELETSRRQLYGGAVVMLDGNHNCESCIAIRMAHIDNQQAEIRTGAGIVYDSDPQTEADETKIKARSVLRAIQLARGALNDHTH